MRKKGIYSIIYRIPYGLTYRLIQVYLSEYHSDLPYLFCVYIFCIYGVII